MDVNRLWPWLQALVNESVRMSLIEVPSGRPAVRMCDECHIDFYGCVKMSHYYVLARDLKSGIRSTKKDRPQMCDGLIRSGRTALVWTLESPFHFEAAKVIALFSLASIVVEVGIAQEHCLKISYMSFKYYRTTPTIVTVLILAGIIDWVVIEVVVPIIESHQDVFGHLRVSTTVSILGLLFAAYDQWLWKLPVFKLLVTVPNMSGRYKGSVRYEFEGNKEEKECFMEVSQTASKIKVHTYFNNEDDVKTTSKSLVEEIKIDEDGFYDIYLFYLNSGSKKGEGLDCHEGANSLRYSPETDNQKASLAGHYFTNRVKQTRGEIEVEFVSSDLKGKF